MLLIAESNPSGHRLGYVKIIADHGRKAGYTVRVLLGHACIGHPNLSIHLPGYAEVTTFGGQVLSLNDIERASRAFESDLVIIPDADALIVRIVTRGGWWGTGKLRLLVMRAPRYELSKPRRAIKSAAIAAARCSRRTQVLILISSVDPHPKRWDVRDPAHLTVLPASPRKASTMRVLMVGAITPRKNPAVVMESVSRLTDLDVEFVLAGTVDARCEEVIAAGAARLAAAGVRFEQDRGPLTDLQFDRYISSAAVVVVAHSNNGPSGILAKAALAGVPVVAAGAPSLRADCDVLGDRAEWAELNADSISGALRRAVLRGPADAYPAATVEEFGERLVSDQG